MVSPYARVEVNHDVTWHDSVDCGEGSGGGSGDNDDDRDTSCLLLHDGGLLIHERDEAKY